MHTFTFNYIFNYTFNYIFNYIFLHIQPTHSTYAFNLRIQQEYYARVVGEFPPLVECTAPLAPGPTPSTSQVSCEQGTLS